MSKEADRARRRAAARRFGVAGIMQLLRLAVDYADRVVTMQDGRITGTP